MGTARSAAQAGAEAVGLVRLERVRLAEGAGENRLQLPLVTSMYLGDRWEHLFNAGNLRVRAYGPVQLMPGPQWLEIPADDLWIFAARS